MREDNLLRNAQLKTDDIDSPLIIDSLKNSSTQARRDHVEVLQQVKLQPIQINALKETVVNLEKMIKLYFECKSPSNRYKKKVCTANVIAVCKKNAY